MEAKDQQIHSNRAVVAASIAIFFGGSSIYDLSTSIFGRREREIGVRSIYSEAWQVGPHRLAQTRAPPSKSSACRWKSCWNRVNDAEIERPNIPSIGSAKEPCRDRPLLLCSHAEALGHRTEPFRSLLWPTGLHTSTNRERPGEERCSQWQASSICMRILEVDFWADLSLHVGRGGSNFFGMHSKTILEAAFSAILLEFLQQH